MNPKESHRVRKNPKNFSESETIRKTSESIAENLKKSDEIARRTRKILEDPKESGRI